MPVNPYFLNPYPVTGYGQGSPGAQSLGQQSSLPAQLTASSGQGGSLAPAASQAGSMGGGENVGALLSGQANHLTANTATSAVAAPTTASAANPAFAGVNGVGGMGGSGMPGDVLSGGMPGAADAAAGGAGGAGGIFSMLGGLGGKGIIPAAGEAGGLSELGLMGGLRAAAPALGASYLANLGLNQILPSTGQAGNVRQVLGDAATGAGLGTAILPGWGTAIGGGLGGAYGLLDSILGGSDNGPDVRKQALDQITAATAGGTLSQDDINRVYGKFDTLWNRIQGQDSKAQSTAVNAFLQGLPNVANQSALEIGDTPGVLSPQNLLAMQTLVGQQMKPAADQAALAGQTASSTYRDMANNPSTNPQLAQLMSAMATNAQQYGQSQQAAITGAAQGIPLSYNIALDRLMRSGTTANPSLGQTLIG